MRTVDIDDFNAAPWVFVSGKEEPLEVEAPSRSWYDPPESEEIGYRAEAKLVKNVFDTEGNPIDIFAVVGWEQQLTAQEQYFRHHKPRRWRHPDWEHEYDTEVTHCELLGDPVFVWTDRFGYEYSPEETLSGDWCDDLDLDDLHEWVLSGPPRGGKAEIKRATLVFSGIRHPLHRIDREEPMNTRREAFRGRDSRSYKKKDYRKHLRSRDRKSAVGGETIRIYIADLAAYNDGRLVGEWVTLPMDEDELGAIIDRLSRNRAHDWAIHDYEAPFRIDEYESPEALNEFMEEVNASYTDLCVVAEAIDQGYDKEEALQAAEDAFVVYAKNRESELAYAIVEELGGIENAVQNPQFYFDYEAYGRDARMDFDEEEDAMFEGMSDQELGEELVEQRGGEHEIQAASDYYFDYEAFGRDLAMDYTFVDCDGEGMWIMFT